MSTLPPNKPITQPPTVRSMITQDLGYCCLWGFFQRFRQTGLIASRLGVAPRTIRIYKSMCKNGRSSCENLPNCMKEKLTKKYY